MLMFFGYICCGFLLGLAALLAALCCGIRDLVSARRSRSWARGMRGGVLVLISVTVVAFAWSPWLRSMVLCFQSPYASPRVTLDEYDLVGTWETTYPDGMVDRLILRADGTFKQVYYDPSQPEDLQETPLESWWLERLPDGGVRVHLHGARYYPQSFVVPDLGSSLESCPENDGACRQRYGQWPYAFYDPIAVETVPMQGALVLDVRVDLFGTLLLHHMRTGPKQLVGLWECEAEHFRQVERP
jgi:hypothetical protein